MYLRPIILLNLMTQTDLLPKLSSFFPSDCRNLWWRRESDRQL